MKLNKGMMLHLKIGVSGISLNSSQSRLEGLEEKPVDDVQHVAHGTADEASMILYHK